MRNGAVWPRRARGILSCWVFLTLTACSTAGEEKALAGYERWKARFAEEGAVADVVVIESSLSPQASLEDLIRFGAKTHPDLKAAFYSWKASLEKIPQARALPNPQLQFTHFLRSVETRAGPQRNRFQLSQKIPWPGKLSLDAEIAYQQSELMRKRLEEAHQNYSYQVKLAYFDLYELQQSIDITKQRLTLAQYYERIALTRYRAARGKHPAVIRAQLELGRLEDRLQSLKDQREPLKARLNAHLNRSPKASIPKILTLDTPPEWPEDAALNDLLRRQNIELNILDEEVKVAERSKARAKREFYPDLSLGVTYIDTASAIRSNTPDSSTDPIAVSFGISLPIWRSKYKAGVREALARRRQSQSRKQSRTRQLEASLQRALFQRRDSLRKIKLYKDSLIPKAEQAQRAAVASFQTGKSDFSEILDVERSLLEFLLNHQKALTDQARANALIEKLIGLPREKKS